MSEKEQMSNGILPRGAKKTTATPTPTVTAQPQVVNNGFGSTPVDQSGSPSRIGVSAMRNQLRTGNSRRQVGEIVNRYAETMKKVFEGNESAHLFVLDGQANSLFLSSLIVAVPVELESGAKLVAAFTLIVEASAERNMPNQDVIIDGNNIAVPLTAGEVFNDTYKGKVLDFVAAKFPGYEVRGAHGMVVYNELDPADLPRMKEVSFYAIEACWRTLDLINGGDLYPYFSIAQFNDTDRTSAYIDYAPVGIEDVCGNPVRADLCVVLSAQPAVQLDKLNPEITDLTRVYGYVELVFREPDQQANIYGQPITQRYAARFNITRIICETDAETLELRLLGLYSTIVLASNEAWATPLRPVKQRPGDDSIPLRDITAIGYEIAAYAGQTTKGARVVGKENNIFTDSDMIDLIRKAVHPGSLSIALHIEECGEMSWMDSVLWNAARGEPVSIETVVHALNRLTNNGFSKYFDHTKQKLFVVDQNRIIRGYRTNMHSKFDLLEMDALAMLNLVGDSDVTKATDYDKTFVDVPGRDVSVRMPMRLRILRDLLTDTMHVKAYGMRIIATSDLIHAMDRAISDLNFNITPLNVFNNYGGGQRGSAISNIEQVAIASTSLAGVFSNRAPVSNSSGFNNGLTWGTRRK